MASSEHERLEQVFLDAVAIRTEMERASFLNEACGDSAALRSHVEGLLRAHERVGSFLEVPPVDPEATLASETAGQAAGSRIGRYKILQEIGQGGFGVVYMAEQEEPVRRKVALKVIKLGMDTKQVIARFEAERQALALMDHPNIARVLDAGASELGRPFFVMELVKGITITEYGDNHKLSTRERLELFLPVCHAVQHAHQKGVIHRDLKPNNVLVTLQDSQPVPKVIDFGIAKATSQRLTERTLFTEFRQFVGTPAYMSPDQIDVRGLDVDTRTDIYSLGILLYELLTGSTPFDAATLRQASFDEIKRIIREVEPPRPSARLQERIAQGVDVAYHRRTDAAALVRLIRGDLDWIVMKALEKDRTRRYATAKDLADDVERHLRHEPVVAGPPGATYKLGKFVRRHRLGVFAGAMVGAALLTGLSLATGGLIQANRARGALEGKRAEAEQARAREHGQRALAEASAAEARTQAERSATVNRFLQEMLRSVDPSQALGREVTMRFVLDEAARKIKDGALGQQPEVEAALRMTLGETYLALGLHDAAAEHLHAAQALHHGQLGEAHPDTLRSDRAWAGLLRITGQFAQAEALLRHTAETQARVLGEEHPDTLATMTELALALWGPGRYAEAEPIHRRTLAIQRRLLGEEHHDTVESLGYLGAVCRALGRLDEAGPLLQRALELSRRVFGEDHPCTGEALNNLGLLREDQQDYPQAEVLYRHTYAVGRRVLGPDHPQTLLAENNLLRVLQRQDKVDDVRPLVAERLARLGRAAQRPQAEARDLHAYAWELLNCEPADLHDPAAALSLATRAVELDNGRDAGYLETLALAHRLSGNLAAAIDTQRRAIARSRVGGPYNRADLEARLSEYLMARGDLLGAAAVGVPWEGLAARLGSLLLPDVTPDADLADQSAALVAEGRYDEAAALLRVCLSMRQKSLPAGHWLIADASSQLGAALVGERKFDEAEPLLLDAQAGLQSNPLAAPSTRREAVRRIIQLYEAWPKPEPAAEWRRHLEQTLQAEGGAG